VAGRIKRMRQLKAKLAVLLRLKAVFGKKTGMKNTDAATAIRKKARSRVWAAKSAVLKGQREAARARNKARARRMKMRKFRRALAKIMAKYKLRADMLKATRRSLKGAKNALANTRKKKRQAALKKTIKERQAKMKVFKQKVRSMSYVMNKEKKKNLKAKKALKNALLRAKRAKMLKIRLWKKRIVAIASSERATKRIRKFRAINRRVARGFRRVASQRLAVKRAEVKAKRAKARALRSASKCKKLKNVNMSIRKMYAKLKRKMSRWAKRNKWLKPRARKLGDSDDLDGDTKSWENMVNSAYDMVEEN